MLYIVELMVKMKNCGLVVADVSCVVLYVLVSSLTLVVAAAWMIRKYSVCCVCGGAASQLAPAMWWCKLSDEFTTILYGSASALLAV